jgi:hypothetical protein
MKLMNVLVAVLALGLANVLAEEPEAAVQPPLAGTSVKPEPLANLITLNLTDVTLKEACSAVKAQAGVIVTSVGVVATVSLNVKDAKVEDVCQSLAKQAGCKLQHDGNLWRFMRQDAPKSAEAPAAAPPVQPEAPASAPVPPVSNRITLKLTDTTIEAACAAIQKQSGVKVTFEYGGKSPDRFDLDIKNASVADACLTLSTASDCLLKGAGDGYVLKSKPAIQKGKKGTGRLRAPGRRIGPIMM